MSMMRIAGIALGAAFLSLILRGTQKETAQLLGIAASLILFSQAMEKMGEAVHLIGQTVENTRYQETYRILLRALGIVSITQIASGICRDTGENSIAGQVELFGKLELVLLSIPLAMQLLSMTETLLS